MNLLGYDYHTDSAAPGVGLARVATLIARAREEVPGLLLFDNGDFLQGTPLGDHAAEAPRPHGKAHPMIAAMNTLRYDAVGLGNHEFDYGLDVLETALSGAKFPVLSANVLRRRGADPLRDDPLAQPWVLLDRELEDEAGVPRKLRIGVLSLLPPQVLHWNSARLGGRMEVRCMIEAARAHVPALRAAGADVVVALAHCGPSDRPETQGMENALLPLAAIDGIDALVAGHVHRLIPGPDYAALPGVDAEAGRVSGKPVVMPGIAGSHLGLIDLWLEPQAPGWRVSETRAELRSIARRGARGPEELVEEAPAVVAAVAKDHAATLAYIRRPVGHSEIALHSYTSLAAPCPVLHAINMAQRWYVRRALPDASLPVLSAAAPFKCGGPAGADNFTDVPPGPLSLRDIAAIYPFPNEIRAIEVTGAQLRDWLERAAGAFNRLTPGTPGQPLLNAAFPRYDFDVIAGLEWEIDLSRPARYGHDGSLQQPKSARVHNLRHDGAPVEDEQRFIVATNSYRIGGGGLYTPLAEAPVVLSEPTGSRDVLMRYIADAGPLRGPVPPSWRFSPLGGACEAVMESGPSVLHHLGAIAESGALQVRAGPLGEDGFQRVHLLL